MVLSYMLIIEAALVFLSFLLLLFEYISPSKKYSLTDNNSKICEKASSSAFGHRTVCCVTHLTSVFQSIFCQVSVKCFLHKIKSGV